MARKLTAITPGEILMIEFIKPLGISQTRLARDLSVPVRRVNDIVQGKRAITPDTALRLAVYFNMTPEFWMNLQSHYDLKLAKHKDCRRTTRIFDSFWHSVLVGDFQTFSVSTRQISANSCR